MVDIGPVSNTSLESGTTQTLELSPVQRALKENEEKNANPLEKSGQESFFESDQFLYAKIAQLQGQLDFYANVPSGVSDGAISSISAEIDGLFTKIREKSAEQNKKAAEAEEKLAEQNRARLEAKSILTPEQLIERAAAKARGEVVEDFDPVFPDEQQDETKLDPSILSVEQLLERAKAAAAENGESLDIVA
jgi:hypothetical protein